MSRLVLSQLNRSGPAAVVVLGKCILCILIFVNFTDLVSLFGKKNATQEPSGVG